MHQAARSPSFGRKENTSLKQSIKRFVSPKRKLAKVTDEEPDDVSTHDHQNTRTKGDSLPSTPKWKKVAGTKDSLAAIRGDYCEFMAFREYLKRKGVHTLVNFWLDYNFWKNAPSTKQQTTHTYYLINTYLTDSGPRNIGKYVHFSIKDLPFDTAQFPDYLSTIFRQVTLILLQNFDAFTIDKPKLERVNEQYCLDLLERDMFGEYGLELRNRKYHYKTYKNSFIGKEAVDWLLRNVYLGNDRTAAVQLGQKNYATRWRDFQIGIERMFF